MASPRSRGWTPEHAHVTPPTAGFPALAGMDPSQARPTPQPSWLPRARGDGPRAADMPTDLPSASPRSRGWTVVFRSHRRHLPGFPALAGMDPRNSGSRRPRRRLPRARGDGPTLCTAYRGTGAASPRSRGWTRGRGTIPASGCGFPALAGMDPVSCGRSRCRRRLPRARGDGPPRKGHLAMDARASPRSRGWTPVALCYRPDDLGFPALAGMDPCRLVSRRGASGLPRARGDGPPTGTDGDDLNRASPRSRGWTQAPAPLAPQDAGFPALAGMDPQDGAARGSCRRLPRARGDGPAMRVSASVRSQASPRSRGWTPGPPPADVPVDGFPALAGMDPRPC